VTYQAIFKRYEIKYILTKAQKEILLKAMAPHMTLDEYGRTTIRNIYFDTENYRLIRRSIEKPAYKEKLRIRSYSQASPESPVFIEIKKKFDSVVYKRRLSMPESSAMAWICEEGAEIPSTLPKGTSVFQIAKEIDYFKDFYRGLRPTVFLSYEREAFYSNDGSDFRVTFDDHILCRQERFSLTEPPGGTSILEDDKVLMEIKTGGGIPLWMTNVLTQEHIYKTSFSKYGTAYQTIIYPQMKGNE